MLEIDDVRIYDRALSAPEVMSLYHLESAAPTENNQNHTDQNATAPVTGDPAPSLFRPYPRTLAREELKDGKFRFWGQILADGGSPVTEVAFELADNMLFRNSTLHSASLFPGSPNFYLELKLEPGKRYYYRAMATNKVGTTAGSTKKLTTSGDGIHWWSDTTPDARRLAFLAVVRNLPQARRHRVDLPCPTGLGLRAPRRFGWLVALGSRITIGPGLNRRLIPTCGITISADGST